MNWLLIFLGFSALVILHEAGHFFAAKATGMRVERFFLFFPPKLVSIKRGETEYGIGAIPAGGFVKISGMNPDEVLPEGEEHRGYYHQPVWKRIVVIGAGPAVNIVLAFAILFVLALGASDPTQTRRRSPSRLARRQRAEARRSHRRDRRQELRRSSTPKGGWKGSTKTSARTNAPASRWTAARRPRRSSCRVERNGQVQTISVRPEYEKSAGRTRIGFSYGTEPANLGVGGAVDRAGDAIWLVTSKTVTVFANIFDSEQRKEVSGVVGVSDVANQTIDVGARESLTLLAIVSLSLGLINLFPFLPLDGGHIFWSLVEKVRGKPVPYRVMERAGALGFVLVIMLFFLGLSNDIGRLTGEGFNVR